MKAQYLVQGRHMGAAWQTLGHWAQADLAQTHAATERARTRGHAPDWAGGCPLPYWDAVRVMYRGQPAEATA